MKFLFTALSLTLLTSTAFAAKLQFIPMKTVVEKVQNRIGNPFFGEQGSGGGKCSVKITELSKTYLIQVESRYGEPSINEFSKNAQGEFKKVMLHSGHNVEELYAVRNTSNKMVYFSVYSRTVDLDGGAWNRTFSLWTDTNLGLNPSSDKSIETRCKYWE